MHWGDFLNELEGLRSSGHKPQQTRQRYARGGSVSNKVKKLAAEGRGGDTKLARIGPRTARMLDDVVHHGRVQRNPRTGLREYMVPGGGKPQGGPAQKKQKLAPVPVAAPQQQQQWSQYALQQGPLILQQIQQQQAQQAAYQQQAQQAAAAYAAQQYPQGWGQQQQMQQPPGGIGGNQGYPPQAQQQALYGALPPMGMGRGQPVLPQLQQQPPPSAFNKKFINRHVIPQKTPRVPSIGADQGTPQRLDRDAQTYNMMDDARNKSDSRATTITVKGKPVTKELPLSTSLFGGLNEMPGQEQRFAPGTDERNNLDLFNSASSGLLDPDSEIYTVDKTDPTVTRMYRKKFEDNPTFQFKTERAFNPSNPTNQIVHMDPSAHSNNDLVYEHIKPKGPSVHPITKNIIYPATPGRIKRRNSITPPGQWTIDDPIPWT